MINSATSKIEVIILKKLYQENLILGKMLNFGRENTSLAAKWWRNVDKQILSLFALLFLMGLFFSFSSTSSVVAEKMNKQTYFFFVKHLVFVFISNAN